MQAQELDENSKSSNSVSLPDKKEISKRNKVWSMSPMERILWSLVLFIWYFLFSYAPGYIGLHDQLGIQICKYACGFCVAIGNANLIMLLNKHIHKFTSLPGATILLTTCTVLFFIGGNAADIKNDPSGLIHQLRLLAFVGSFGSSLGLVMLLPFMAGFLIENFRNIVKVFSKKNAVSIFLAALTVATAIFQLVQVLMSLIQASIK